jgi:hypothetical protein
LQKNSKRLPTAEEFLQFIPKRLDFEWFKNEEGLVRIKVPKFKSNIGKSFCKVIKKENVFTANLDKLGSIVWLHSNGRNSVKDILQIVKKEFSKEENLDQRLFFFLSQLKNLNYIDY